MRIGLNDQTERELILVMNEINSKTPSLTVAELIKHYHLTKRYPNEVKIIEETKPEDLPSLQM